jgi:hypothetical protein
MKPAKKQVNRFFIRLVLFESKGIILPGALTDLFLRGLYRLNNPVIAGTSAEVAFHFLSNYLLRCVRECVEACLCGHQHAGRAESALHGAGFNESLLQRVQPSFA